MGRIVVTEFVSLDGVMEAPGGGEDFKHAGWTFKIARGKETMISDELFERIFLRSKGTREVAIEA